MGTTLAHTIHEQNIRSAEGRGEERHWPRRRASLLVESSAAPPLALDVGNREDDIFVAPPAALEVDGNDLAGFHGDDDPPEALDVRHRLAIDLEDGVPSPDPRLLPGAAGRHIGDDDARLGGQLEPLAG